LNILFLALFSSSGPIEPKIYLPKTPKLSVHHTDLLQFHGVKNTVSPNPAIFNSFAPTIDFSE